MKILCGAVEVTAKKAVPSVQIVGKGVKNRAMAQRTASEKDAGKMDGQRGLTAFKREKFAKNKRNTSKERL